MRVGTGWPTASTAPAPSLGVTHVHDKVRRATRVPVRARSGRVARVVPREAEPRGPACDAAAMKIATWNVNGIRARQAQVQDWIDQERPDIVCLQEIKASQDQVPAALCEMEGYWCYWHGFKGYSGVGLHVSK